MRKTLLSLGLILTLILTNRSQAADIKYVFDFEFTYTRLPAQLATVIAEITYDFNGAAPNAYDTLKITQGKNKANYRHTWTHGKKIYAISIKLKTLTDTLLGSYNYGGSSYNSNPPPCNGYIIDAFYNGNNCVAYPLLNVGTMCTNLEFNFATPTEDFMVGGNSNNSIICVTDNKQLTVPCLFGYKSNGKNYKWLEADSTGKNWKFLASGSSISLSDFIYKTSRPTYNYARYFKVVLDSEYITAGKVHSQVFGPIFYFIGEKPDSFVVQQPICADGTGDISFRYQNEEETEKKVAPIAYVRGTLADGTPFSYYTDYLGKSPVSLNGKPGYKFNYKTNTWDRDTVRIYAGKYTTLIDFSPWNSYDCKYFIDSFVVALPGKPIFTSSFENVKCPGDADGRISLEGDGFREPYQYSLDGKNYLKNPIFIDLDTGNYTPVIQDNMGCLYKIAPVRIEQPLPFLITTAKKTGTICFYSSDGSIELQVLGGNSTSTYTIGMMDNPDISAGLKLGESLKNLPAGENKFWVRSDWGCKLPFVDSIPAAPIFVIDKVSTLPTTCYETNDAKAWVNVSGGEIGDTYKISTDYSTWYDLGDTMYNVASGNLQFTVRNQLGCENTENKYLQKTPKARNWIHTDTTFCNGQSMLVDYAALRVQNVKVKNGFWQIANTDTFTLSKEGLYIVTGTTDKGCSFNDTLRITRSNRNIKHGFAMRDAAGLTETVYVFDHSKPTADRSEWILSNDYIDTMRKTGSLMAMTFPYTGMYTVTLKSEFGPCTFISSKNIEILEESPYGPGGVLSPWIQEFYVTPNPGSGDNFKVVVKLKEAAPITLYKINPVSQSMTDVYHGDNQQDYVLDIFKGGKTEVFFIKLIVKNEVKTIKVVMVK